MEESDSDWEYLATVLEEIWGERGSVEVEKQEPMGFVDGVDLEGNTEFSNQLPLSCSVRDEIELCRLTQQFHKGSEFLILCQFLHESSHCGHRDVVIAAHYPQISRAQLRLLLLLILSLTLLFSLSLYLNALDALQILHCILNNLRQIIIDPYLRGLLEVIVIRVLGESPVHKGPGDPINAVFLALYGLRDYLRVDMGGEVEVEGGLYRVGLEQELLVELSF